MQKNNIDRFIQKYNLGGNAESVKWVTKNNKLTTRFVTNDSSMLGQVELDNFIFEDSALGVYDTSQLKGLLSVVDDDIELSTQKLGDRVISLGIKNGKCFIKLFFIRYSCIPAAPNLKHIPDFET